MLNNAIARRPLISILLLAAFLRLIASFWSEGYLMYEDHFSVIEAGASWADGVDYNNWLPKSQEAIGRTPSPHNTNFTYAGLHYGFFKSAKYLGVNNPMQLALILRLLHGMLSLISVLLAFKIVERLSNSQAAVWVGFAMAGLAIMPILSVHQLVEMVCITPLLASTWVLIRKDALKRGILTYLIAGGYLGLAIGLKYQVGVFGIGLVIALIVERFSMQNTKDKSLKKALLDSFYTGFAAIVVFSLTQIPQDIILGGEPFAQLKAYIEYNLTESGNYPQGHPWTFILVIVGIIAPPVSIALLFGYFRFARKYALLVIPSLTFLVFHSISPNKQEHFILPMLPYVIMAGTMGWLTFRELKGFFSSKNGRLLEKGALTLAIAINIVALFALTLSSRNTSEMKAMYSLNQRGDLNSFLYVSADGVNFPPRFYSGSWQPYTTANLNTNVANQKLTLCMDANVVFPNYILIVGDRHVGDLAQTFKTQYTSMSYLEQFAPGRLDRFLNFLNPNTPLKRVMLYSIVPDIECQGFSALN